MEDGTDEKLLLRELIFLLPLYGYVSYLIAHSHDELSCINSQF